MFDVFTCGFSPARLAAYPEATQVGTLPDPTRPEFIDEGLGLFAKRPAGRRVLLIHAAHPATTRRVATLRALHQSPDVLPVPIRRPYTGLASVATWLAALSARRVSSGVAMAALDRILDRLPTYAVTSSVASLDLPEVRLRHHLLSWVSFAVFAVSVGQHPKVQVGKLDVPELRRSDDLYDLITAGESKMAGRLAGAMPARVDESLALDLPDGDPVWWGKSRYYSMTAIPRTVDEFARSLTAENWSRCHQCGDAVLGTCPFCLVQEGVHA